MGWAEQPPVLYRMRLMTKSRPELPADLKSGGILIFSKTSGFRDEASIEASNAALAAIAKERGWPYFVTENGAVMNKDQLARFRLVIWNNASGDPLTEDQRAAFRAWVENGGSFMGVHGAGGDPVENHGHTSLADWKWYVDTLIGAQFVVHSRIMPGDIKIEDRKSPIAKICPKHGIGRKSGTHSSRVLGTSLVFTSWRQWMRRHTLPDARQWASIIHSYGGTAWAKAMPCIPLWVMAVPCMPSH